MSTPTDDSVISASYDYNSFPFLAPRDTLSRMRHFPSEVYSIASSSHLYKFVDALCGDAGAGSLKKELLFASFNQNLSTIFFRDIDDIFGKIAGLARYASESYTFDPTVQQLTTDAWSEVMVKDNAFRQRIRDFMLAIGLGGTPQGFRLMCRAVLAVDCDLFEVSNYIDSGLYSNIQSLGRTNTSLRREVVVRPLMSSISTAQHYLLNNLLDRIRPQDTVLTINTQGLAICKPVTINSVSASSSYFQVQSHVTGTRDVSKLPPPQVLSEELQIDPSYLWIQPNETVEAPYAAFQATQEISQYYTYSNDSSSVIDTIQYCEDNGSGTRVLNTIPFTEYTVNSNNGFGPWTAWDFADSPDNFPGGKNGQTPHTGPAVTMNATEYNFPYLSQSDFVAKQSNVILSLGGEVTELQYRLPITNPDEISRHVYDPSLAVPLIAPSRQSTVTSRWFNR